MAKALSKQGLHQSQVREMDFEPSPSVPGPLNEVIVTVKVPARKEHGGTEYKFKILRRSPLSDILNVLSPLDGLTPDPGEEILLKWDGLRLDPSKSGIELDMDAQVTLELGYRPIPLNNSQNLKKYDWIARNAAEDLLIRVHLGRIQLLSQNQSRRKKNWRGSRAEMRWMERRNWVRMSPLKKRLRQGLRENCLLPLNNKNKRKRTVSSLK